MAKRCTQLPKMKKDCELKYMWGLSIAVDSCQGRLNYDTISPMRSYITDHHRELQNFACSKDECRKIQNRADLDRTQGLVKRQRRSKMESEILLPAHKRDRKKNRRAHRLASTSAEMSLNEHTLVAGYGAVCAPDHHQAGADSDSILSHYFQSFFDLDKCNEVDKMKLGQVLLARHFAHNKAEVSSELRSKHDQYMGLFQLVDSVVARKEGIEPCGSTSKRSGKLSECSVKNEQVDCGCSSMGSKTLSRRTSSDQKVTSFFFREIKKKLKHTFQGTPVVGITQTNKSPDAYKKSVKSKQGSVSNVSKRTSVKEQEFEAKRRLSLRLKKVKCEEALLRSPKTLKHVLSSSDLDIKSLGPRRESHHSQGWRASKMVAENFNAQDGSSSIANQLHCEVSRTRNSNNMHSDGIEFIQKDPLSVSVSTTDDGVNNHQIEHESPVSVLEPFFTESGLSPPSEKRSDVAQHKKLQPLQLDFEDCSLESSPKNELVSTDLCKEDESHLSHYVHLVMQGSCLNWNKLSEIKSPSEELLQDNLFDEVDDSLHTHYHFNQKLVFDHINEVLVEIYQSYFSSVLQPAISKSKIMALPLAGAVIDEIMTRADFYLHPQTERRSLDRIVTEDVAEYRSWFDMQCHTENVVNDISEDVLEDTVMHMLCEFVI